MCNNGFGGGNCCWIIILLIIIWFCCGNNSLGSVALGAIMHKNRGRYMLCACRENVKPFYIKNGFKPLYKAGYWRKNT